VVRRDGESVGGSWQNPGRGCPGPVAGRDAGRRRWERRGIRSGDTPPCRAAFNLPTPVRAAIGPGGRNSSARAGGRRRTAGAAPVPEGTAGRTSLPRDRGGRRGALLRALFRVPFHTRSCSSLALLGTAPLPTAARIRAAAAGRGAGRPAH